MRERTERKPHSAKNSTIMQRVICIPFGKHLKTDNSKKFCAMEKKFNHKLQNQAA